MMIKTVEDFQNPFFIGVAGVGMSALAQYLSGIGKKVSGSDRYFVPRKDNHTKNQLEAAGILCFPQDGSGMAPGIDLVVVSTAIEDTVPEVILAKEKGIPILRRSQVLALIAESKKTIAIGGTSGKSSTVGMLYQILDGAGFSPSVISGAGLTRLIRQGKIGNARVGEGEWLIIEADESDGSIVQYKPEIGVLLNVDKDHQEISELMNLFRQFKENTKGSFIVNQSNPHAAELSESPANDFGFDTPQAGFSVENFHADGFVLNFTLLGQPFHLKALGRHSAENAAAAVAVAHQIEISLESAAKSLADYEGIYRRHQILGEKNGVVVIDDYAHNPAKCAASIRAVQPLGQRVIAWFQPHGYGPTRFLRKDFVEEIGDALRPQDQIWMSEIYYAGGAAEKDISAGDLIEDLKAKGKTAHFIKDRNLLLEELRPHLQPGTVLLLMGARDPELETFAKNLYSDL